MVVDDVLRYLFSGLQLLPTTVSEICVCFILFCSRNMSALFHAPVINFQIMFSFAHSFYNIENISNFRNYKINKIQAVIHILQRSSALCNSANDRSSQYILFSGTVIECIGTNVFFHPEYHRHLS